MPRQRETGPIGVGPAGRDKQLRPVYDIVCVPVYSQTGPTMIISGGDREQ